jgi:cytochrome c
VSITRWRAAAVAALHDHARRSGGGASAWITRRSVEIGAALLTILMASPAIADAQSRGQQVFSSTCMFCHFADTTDRKVGPGLMGLFRRERLPVSGDRVSDERVRRQIRQGSGAMPPHGHLSAADVEALVEYLKTL